jgi:hypothetical protein
MGSVGGARHAKKSPAEAGQSRNNDARLPMHALTVADLTLFDGEEVS